MSDFSSSDRPASARDLAGIIRLVRRICLYREQGEVDRAERLHADELLSAVAEYRLWHGPDSLTDEKLCVIFVNETENMREALAVAAMVVPDLARVVPPPAERAKPVFPSAIKMGSLKPFPDNPPAITELLDAMLAAKPPGDHEPPANGGLSSR